jgi:hypothetical protein
MALFQTLSQRRLAVLFFLVRQQPALILRRSRKSAYSLPTSQPVRCKMAILMSNLGGTACQSRMGRRLRIRLKSPPKLDGGRPSSICSGEQTPHHAATRVGEKTAWLVSLRLIHTVQPLKSSLRRAWILFCGWEITRNRLGKGILGGWVLS